MQSLTGIYENDIFCRWIIRYICVVTIYNLIIKVMNIKPIKTDFDYKEALNRLEGIFDAAVGTIESD